jgi:hypothetical protein
MNLYIVKLVLHTSLNRAIYHSYSNKIIIYFQIPTIHKCLKGTEHNSRYNKLFYGRISTDKVFFLYNSYII